MQELTKFHFSAQFPNEFIYAVFSGDAPAHDVWAQSKENNFDHTRAVINAFQKYFPDLPLYVSIGNHEGSVA